MLWDENQTEETLRRASLFLTNGKHDEARKILRKGIDLSTRGSPANIHTARMINVLGESLLQTNSYPEAILQFETAIRILAKESAKKSPTNKVLKLNVDVQKSYAYTVYKQIQSREKKGSKSYHDALRSICVPKYIQLVEFMAALPDINPTELCETQIECAQICNNALCFAKAEELFLKARLILMRLQRPTKDVDAYLIVLHRRQHSLKRLQSVVRIQMAVRRFLQRLRRKESERTDPPTARATKVVPIDVFKDEIHTKPVEESKPAAAPIMKPVEKPTP
eukprot:PhF_6_TR13018/c0_g1_i2/m.20631